MAPPKKKKRSEVNPLTTILSSQPESSTLSAQSGSSAPTPSQDAKPARRSFSRLAAKENVRYDWEDDLLSDDDEDEVLRDEDDEEISLPDIQEEETYSEEKTNLAMKT